MVFRGVKLFRFSWYKYILSNSRHWSLSSHNWCILRSWLTAVRVRSRAKSPHLGSKFLVSNFDCPAAKARFRDQTISGFKEFGIYWISLMPWKISDADFFELIKLWSLSSVIWSVCSIFSLDFIKALGYQ